MWCDCAESEGESLLSHCCLLLSLQQTETGRKWDGVVQSADLAENENTERGKPLQGLPCPSAKANIYHRMSPGSPLLSVPQPANMRQGRGRRVTAPKEERNSLLASVHGQGKSFKPRCQWASGIQHMWGRRQRCGIPGLASRHRQVCRVTHNQCRQRCAHKHHSTGLAVCRIAPHSCAEARSDRGAHLASPCTAVSLDKALPSTEECQLPHQIPPHSLQSSMCSCRWEGRAHEREAGGAAHMLSVQWWVLKV